MSECRKELASMLKGALGARSVTVDGLASATKVPKSTILWLLDEPVTAVLPARAYLRGQLALLAAELGIDRGRASALFDEAHPRVDARSADQIPAFGLDSRSMAIAAGLAGIALLAVVLAFAH